MDVILPPMNLDVHTDDLEPGQALLTWTDPTSITEFRWDDGTAIGQLGSSGGTLNTVLALCTATMPCCRRCPGT
jgi:hypothetical protein